MKKLPDYFIHISVERTRAICFPKIDDQKDEKEL